MFVLMSRLNPPVLAVFLVLQRFFTRGIAMTGLKG
jgi:ABC-type maltose transport system permease subunit